LDFHYIHFLPSLSLSSTIPVHFQLAYNNTKKSPWKIRLFYSYQITFPVCLLYCHNFETSPQSS